VIATRAPKDNAEMMTSLDSSIQGNESSLRPDGQQPMEMSRADVIKRANPLSDLRKRHTSKPKSVARVNIAVKESGNSEEAWRWLPFTSRRQKPGPL
jgi:hypothetical protein